MDTGLRRYDAVGGAIGSQLTHSSISKLRTRSLIFQCSDDVIAPVSVGEYVRNHVDDSQLAILAA
jgi:hypothetical protein